MLFYVSVAIDNREQNMTRRSARIQPRIATDLRIESRAWHKAWHGGHMFSVNATQAATGEALHDALIGRR